MNWNKLKRQKQKEIDEKNKAREESMEWLEKKGIKAFEKRLYKEMKGGRAGEWYRFKITEMFTVLTCPWMDMNFNCLLAFLTYQEKEEFTKKFVEHISNKGVDIKISNVCGLSFCIKVP